MNRRAWSLFACLSLASISLLVPRPAAAQGLREVRGNFRSVLGAGGTVLRPVGEFQDYVQWGGGFNVFAVVNPARSLPVGLRMDGAVMMYGHETFPVLASPSLPRVALEGTTNNLIASMGIGPQVTLGTGWLRAYGYGTVGFAYFATTSELRGSAGGAFGTTTNFDDLIGSLAGGGGLLIELSSRRRPILLDLSAVSVRSGPTRYLREGSLTDLPDGTVAFTPIQSRTDMVQLRVGVAVGLR